MKPEIKSKFKLAFLLLITILPVSLATIAFKSAVENGTLSSTKNYGTLIIPPADISALAMTDQSGVPVFRSFEEEIKNLTDESEYEIKPWLLVYVGAKQCDESCFQRLHYLKQLHIALGKNIQRVRRYYLSAINEPIDQEVASQFRSEYPSMGVAFTNPDTLLGNMRKAGIENFDPTTQNYVLLIDPVGNVMMYYTDEQSAEEIMTDLETLLKYSSLG